MTRARAIVTLLENPHDQQKIEEHARVIVEAMSRYSGLRSVFLIYGQEVKLTDPNGREFENLSKRRGALWVGTYKGPAVGVERVKADLGAALKDWFGASHAG